MTVYLQTDLTWKWMGCIKKYENEIICLMCSVFVWNLKKLKRKTHFSQCMKLQFEVCSSLWIAN